MINTDKLTDLNSEVTSPVQKLPRSRKTKEWAKAVIDNIIANSSTYYNNYGVQKTRMKINYDLYNGIINTSDFSYVTNPYGLDKDYPAKFAHYDIITPKINLLLGEEINRPFNYRVVCTDGAAHNRYMEKQKELIMQLAQSEFVSELAAQGIEPNEEVISQFQSLPEIKKYMSYDYQDIAEITASKSLTYLTYKETCEHKFNKGWKDALISGREVYYVGAINGEPSLEVVNPIMFDHDKDPDLDYIEDGQWALQVKYCTPASVIDTYYQDLTDSQIKYIDQYANTQIPNPMDINHPLKAIVPEIKSPLISPAPAPITQDDSYYRRNNHIRVVRVEWKSLRKIGFLSYYDAQGNIQETIVDETYSPIVELGQTVKWVWIPQVWEGTKIGDCIYVNVGPKSIQFGSIEDPAHCQLGFRGYTYNNRNSELTSMIDIVKPHQYLYNIIMYRMELEIAKAKGKKMVIDLAQIPKSMGIDLEKWMYYFDNVGLAFINSFEEGKGKFAGQLSPFNQFQNIDMTLSQSVGQYITILQKIEDMVGELVGVSRQRQGSINTSESVGGVERAVTQSSFITEKLFYEHNEVKKRVLAALLDCSKETWTGGKNIQYILPDMSRIFLSIDPSTHCYSDYAIFITNSGKDLRIKEDLKALAQAALSAGVVTFSDIVEVVKSDSVTEIANKIKQSEMERQQETQAQRESESQNIQAQIQAQKELADAQRDFEAEQNQLDRDNKIAIAQINSMSFDEEKDINNNQVPDALEYQKLIHQIERDNRDMKLKENDLEFRKEKQKEDAQLKRKAIQTKPKSK